MEANYSDVLSEHVLDVHLLGTVGFDEYVRLQRRLAYALQRESSPRAVLLLCEHQPIITVGRAGSRSHIHLTTDELDRERLAVRWVERAGGCVLHAPGQLAVYPLLPLRRLGWRGEDYPERLQDILAAAIKSLGITTQVAAEGHGLQGRTGLLAALGVSQRRGISTFGAYINVAPTMTHFDRIETAANNASPRPVTMGCLLAERRWPVKMTSVRAAVVESLVAALGCARHNLHTGHLWLRETVHDARTTANRAP